MGQIDLPEIVEPGREYAATVRLEKVSSEQRADPEFGAGIRVEILGAEMARTEKGNFDRVSAFD